MDDSRLTYLFGKYYDKASTAEEREELMLMLDDDSQEALLKDLIERKFRSSAGELIVADDTANEIFQAIISREKRPIIQHIEPERLLQNEQISINSGDSSAHVRHMHLLRKWGWAAAIILVLGAATIALIMTSDQQSLQQTVTGNNKPSPSDILPGSNRAILTIDNKAIELTGHKKGITVGNSITYNDGERIAEAGKMLQLTTPRGGQYQAVLPDGSKVWLNAASSVRFPSKFTGNKREVDITGEVYLEIAKNSKQPFTLHANGTNIEVLGTSFNVNMYEDEAALKATLVDGSIKVLTVGKAFILKPGQQAVVMEESVKTQSADIEQILAWKNGVFNIHNADLQTVLRQLARWYDIDIRYKGTPPMKYFQGKLDRGLSLIQVIEALSQIQPTIDFKLEGRTLIVEQKK